MFNVDDEGMTQIVQVRNRQKIINEYASHQKSDWLGLERLIALALTGSLKVIVRDVMMKL